MRRHSSLLAKMVDLELQQIFKQKARSPKKSATEQQVLADNANVKRLLIATQFVNELTQHSNPVLQGRLAYDQIIM